MFYIIAEMGTEKSKSMSSKNKKIKLWLEKILKSIYPILGEVLSITKVNLNKSETLFYCLLSNLEFPILEFIVSENLERQMHKTHIKWYIWLDS